MTLIHLFHLISSVPSHCVLTPSFTDKPIHICVPSFVTSLCWRSQNHFICKCCILSFPFHLITCTRYAPGIFRPSFFPTLQKPVRLICLRGLASLWSFHSSWFWVSLATCLSDFLCLLNRNLTKSLIITGKK